VNHSQVIFGKWVIIECNYQPIFRDIVYMSIENRRRKDLTYYLSLPYTIQLTPDKNGVWFASIPILKGCMTQGDNREHALIMLDEAKEL